MGSLIGGIKLIRIESGGVGSIESISLFDLCDHVMIGLTGCKNCLDARGLSGT
jgi:hypothetical protein